MKGRGGIQIVLAQLAPEPGNPAANLERVETVLRDSVPYLTSEARIAVFPELFVSGYGATYARRLAQEVEGAWTEALLRLARRYEIALIIGLPERGPQGELFNSVVAVDANGMLRGIYRKVHLYAHERDLFEPGSDLVVVDLGFARLGLGICYDVEFPEWSRLLALSGAGLLVFPSAHMSPWEEHLRCMAKCRALENHRTVVVANRVGSEEGLVFSGLSGVWKPDGVPNVLAPHSEEAVLVATVRDLDSAARPFDYLLDRRPELYTPICKPTRKEE